MTITHTFTRDADRVGVSARMSRPAAGLGQLGSTRALREIPVR